MARTLRLLLACTLLLIGVAVHAQNPQPSPNTAQIILGQSAVPLYGPWKFSVGDSPIDPKTGKPLWAEPDFDDSRWETVDLTPKDATGSAIPGFTGLEPGWAAKGHPGYWGYAWYRIRVRVQSQQGGDLALEGPADVEGAYQVFDNGELVGHSGDFTGGKPVSYGSLFRLFRLPGPGSQGATGGQEMMEQSQTGRSRAAPTGLTQVLCFRIWLSPQMSHISDGGGLRAAPVLGQAAAVAAGYQVDWLEAIRASASAAVVALLLGQLAMVAFTLILFDRSDRVYLWMAALFLLSASLNGLDFLGNCTQVLSFANNNLVLDFVEPATNIAWVMVWWVWFGERRPRWLPGLTVGLALMLMVVYVLSDEYFYGLISHEASIEMWGAVLPLRLLLFAPLLWVVIDGIRQQGVEGWLVLPVVMLHGLNSFPGQLPFTDIATDWFPFGVAVNFFLLSNALVALVIVVLLLRRLLRSVKRQRLMALDVKQAQEVQQVILPETRLVLPGLAGQPGLTIESEYRPAREVGGDFFQIIPHQTDGSLLIVAGDVSGKGLKAGMLVALLVGAIRSTAETDSDPAAILASLNRRLIGRGDAQATCLALRIEADGGATLANAGHIAPYLNGEELPMEGALPLGLFEGAEPSVMHFELKDGDKLILMSDGIAEATDANGKLFGFERVHALLRTARNAAEVAEAAQAFGQEDDISVISVTRAPALEPAMA